MNSTEARGELRITTIECAHGGGHDWIRDDEVCRIAFDDINPFIGVSSFTRTIRERCLHCDFLRWVDDGTSTSPDLTPGAAVAASGRSRDRHRPIARLIE